MQAAPRIVLLEDHPLVREALVDRLRAHLGDVTIVYAGQSVADALAAMTTTGADCVILDLDLNDARSPVANVLDLAETDVPILIVSALGDQASIRASLMAGASGFISKQAEPEQLIEAVQATLRGEQYTTQRSPPRCCPRHPRRCRSRTRSAAPWCCTPRGSRCARWPAGWE